MVDFTLSCLITGGYHMYFPIHTVSFVISISHESSNSCSQCISQMVGNLNSKLQMTPHGFLRNMDAPSAHDWISATSPQTKHDRNQFSETPTVFRCHSSLESVFQILAPIQIHRFMMIHGKKKHRNSELTRTHQNSPGVPKVAGPGPVLRHPSQQLRGQGPGLRRRPRGEASTEAQEVPVELLLKGGRMVVEWWLIWDLKGFDLGFVYGFCLWSLFNGDWMRWCQFWAIEKLQLCLIYVQLYIEYRHL